MIKVDFNPPETMLRQFGWVGLVAYPVIALVVLWRFTDWHMNWVVYTLFGLGVLCVLLAMAAPWALRPLYVGMMLVAFPIGLVLSAVMLRLIYYLLFTPMALWFKIIGRDTMHRRLDPDAETYWTDHRDVQEPRSPASYLRIY